MLSDLYYFSIWDNNNVFGPIPYTFCNLSNLELFSFFNLNLNGIIPECIANLS